METKTAVQWLINELTPSIKLQQKYIDEIKSQAKEIEKEQIKKAWLSAFMGSMINPLDKKHYEQDAEEYYNKNFK